MNNIKSYPELSAAPLSGKRIEYLDMLKVLAIFGVIIIHISSDALFRFNIASVDWYLSVFWASIVRWSVPVFFMCSGVLFLNSEKDIPLKRIFTKYLPRIIAALVFWAVMYEIFDVLRVCYSTGIVDSAAVIKGIKNLLTFNTHFHLYYLYIIILVYLFVPMIKVFTDNATKSQMEYALLIWVAVGVVLPFALGYYPFTQLKGIVLQYPLKLAYSSMGYFILGHYLNKYSLSRHVTLGIYAAGVLGFAVTLCGVIMTSVSSKSVNAVFLEGMSPNIAAMAAALFLSIKNLYAGAGNNIGTKTNVISFIAKGSFCVYLVHDFFNIMLRTLHFHTGIFTPGLSIPFLSILNLLLSLGVYWVLSKVPVVKKYLI